MRVCKIPVQIIGDVEIEILVVIEVDPETAETPESVVDPRRCGRFLVGAVAVVVQQGIGAEITHVQIGKPVAVVIANSTAVAEVRVTG